MAVDTLHADYAAELARWTRMRDTIAGSDAVHTAGERYIPSLPDQSAKDYNAYNGRAVWLGATGSTVSELHGLVMRKEPQVTAPAGLAEIVRDADMAGRSISDLASDVVRELLSVGRIALVVDHPAAVEGVVSAADAAKAGLRPRISTYVAEDVGSWREERINNLQQLSLLILSERAEVSSDPYSTTYAPQRRVLRLVNNVYMQEIWQRTGGVGEWYMVSAFAPLSNGKTLSFIPAIVVTSDGITSRVCTPPLIDLADLNLSHFRTSADLEHGAHFTGLPTAVISGYSKQVGDDELMIGSPTAWTFSDPSAKASYLEFTGQGLSTLERLMDRKEEGMAALGARLLSTPKAGVESAQALEIRTTGETSMLASIAKVAGRALTIALIWARDWSSVAGPVAVEVNTDFALAKLSGPELTSIVGAWQAGAISYQTLHHNLRRGELIPAGIDAETEQAQIGTDAPQLGAV